jgi:hypothetical protein
VMHLSQWNLRVSLLKNSGRVLFTF